MYPLCWLNGKVTSTTERTIHHIVRRKWYDIVPTAGDINDVTQYGMPCQPGTENEALVGELTVTSTVKDWKQPKLRIRNVINNNI